MRFFKSSRLSEDSVRQTLTNHGVAPERVDSLLVQENGNVTLALLATPAELEAAERDRYEIEQVLRGIKGAGDVRVILTANNATGTSEIPPASGTQRVRKGANLSGSVKAQTDPSRASPGNILSLPNVKNIVAVASAKGGVGKSTTALNLAMALSQMGLKVGVLDADVYGPSIPTMTDTTDTQPEYTEEKKLKPVEALGLKLMSIGYVSDVDAPMIWRGPIVMSAISQMMKDVDWGELDLLIIDTPPGTGDAQLTLAQKVLLSGAVIVSTPQEVALADVRRGVAMFRKTNVPVLGIVENMAWFEDPASGNRTFIFGEGGARRMAETLSIPLLGEVPLLPEIRAAGDAGHVDSQTSGSRQSELYAEIAERMLNELANAAPEAQPKIVFE